MDHKETLLRALLDAAFGVAYFVVVGLASLAIDWVVRFLETMHVTPPIPQILHFAAIALAIIDVIGLIIVVGYATYSMVRAVTIGPRKDT